MLISKRKRFIFIHTYKVAGTSVTQALQEYCTPALWERAARKLGCALSVPRSEDFHQHIKARELREQLPSEIYDRYYKFAFVRNPWDWQVSLYHFALETETHHQYDLVKSFADFGEYLHWRVTEDVEFQSDFVTDAEGNMIVDFVGRLERIDEEFAKVCSKLGLSASLPHANRSAHRDYKTYYTPETIELIGECFRADIERFGYTFDGCS